MKLSQQERDSLRENFRKMDTRAKVDYIYTYFKWYILLGVIALMVLGSAVYRQVTKKDTVIYLGLVNVSVGTDLETALTLDFLEDTGLNPKQNQIQVYSGLYLSDESSAENHEYAYASRMKLMAAVNAKQLDVVLMNREAYNILSQSGYLLDLSGCATALAPYLTENDVVLEDNSIEFQLNEADEHRIITEQAVNGMDVSQLSLFRNAGFPDSVYIGIIGNSPRYSVTIQYLEYLVSTIA